MSKRDERVPRWYRLTGNRLPVEDPADAALTNRATDFSAPRDLPQFSADELRVPEPKAK
jgi:hypothetical protein